MPLRFEERALAGSMPEHASLHITDGEMLQLLSAFGPLASWRVDVATSHYWVSHALYDLFELDFAEGRASLLAFRERIHPDDINLLHEALVSAIDRQGSFCLTYRIRSGDRYKFIRTIGRFRANAETEGDIIGVSFPVPEAVREVIIGN